MQVSSVDQSYLLSLYANALNKTATSTDTATQGTASADTATISSEAQTMPPPPHEMDFESMSNDELKEYMQQMYNITGMLPGGKEGSVQDLSEDELAQLREVLVEMSASSPVAQAMSSQDTSGLSGDDFKTLLALFMISMQSGMSGAGDSSSSSELLFSSDSDYVTQLVLDSIMNKLTDSGSEESQTQAQQAAEAYAQNMTIL